MDLSKYPLERLFGFVAAVFPGLVALLIYEVAAPGSLGWFFALGFLGYRTKISIILLVAFVVGITMTNILAIVLGLIVDVSATIVALQRFRKPAYSYDVAPWRDPAWRAAIKQKLGAKAPNDTLLLTEGALSLRQIGFTFLPKEQQEARRAALEQEKLSTQSDDVEWESWYNHYHRIVLNPKRDFVWYVQTGLSFNLETAAVYVLIAATVVPTLRQWWSLSAAIMWCTVLVADSYVAWKRFTDRWMTLADQINCLTKEGPTAAIAEEK